MQAFTNYSPNLFSQNPHTLVPCAQITCEAVVPFGHMVVWGWLQKEEPNFRAFCCQAHALDALPETHFNQA